MKGQAKEYFDLVRRNEGLLWLLLIMLLAAGIRLNGITFQSYWYDELFSAYISSPVHSFAEVVRLTLADVHPPLFQLSMWWSYKLFGYNEFAGRLPSLLAGTGAIAVIYLLGRDLISRRVGLYAAAFAVPNYYLVYYAQEARSYAFLYFLCSLSFLFFFRALRSASRLNIALYVFSTIALLYTHYFVFVALAAQGFILVAYLLYERSIDKALLSRAGIALVCIVAAALPLVSTIQAHSAIDTFWIPQPDSFFVIEFFVRYFELISLAVIFGLLFIVGSFAPTGGRRRDFAIWFLLIWLVVGYVVPWARGLVAQPIITDRNTIMLVPPILLLAAIGLTRIPVLWVQRATGLAVVLYSWWGLAVVVDYDDSSSKGQFREMARALGDFDPALPVYALKFNDTKYNVYFNQQGSGLFAQDAAVLADELAAGDGPPIFWLADGHRRTLQTDLDEDYSLVEVGRYKFRKTAAALLLNPDASKEIVLRRMPTESGPNAVSSAPFNLASTDTLLISFAATDDPAKSVGIELLNAAGQPVATALVEPGPMDSAFHFRPENFGAGRVRVVIRADEKRGDPQLWVLEGGAAGLHSRGTGD